MILKSHFDIINNALDETPKRWNIIQLVFTGLCILI